MNLSGSTILQKRIPSRKHQHAKYICIALLLTLLSFDSQSQHGSITFEAYTGAGAGWWVYSKIMNDSLGSGYLSHDRTHLALMVPYGADVLLQVRKLKLGAGFTFRQLQDNVMVEASDSPVNTSVYSVAGYNVEILQFHFTGEYLLHESKKFTFAPNLKVGSFQLYADHPMQNEFKNKYFIEAGFTFERRLNSPFALFIRPQYLYMIIKAKEVGNVREMHHIYSFGLQAGFRIRLNER